MSNATVKQSLSNPGLWATIRDAELPGETLPKSWFSGAREISFCDRLDRKLDLTEDSARRLEAEYRRYLYLKAVDGGLLTPSARVDQAWHLHLETPDNAWGRFCDTVLGCRVEHRTGLSPDRSKAAYERTLDLYRQEFQDEPPRDIWPGDQEERRALLGARIFMAGFYLAMLGWLIAMGTLVVENLSDHQGANSLSDLLAVFMFFGGIGIVFLGAFVARGTDLVRKPSCA